MQQTPKDEVSDPVRNIAALLVELLPLAGNAGAVVLMIDAVADPGDEHGFAGFEPRRLEMIECAGFHEERLLQLEMVEARGMADRFGRDAEMVAERAGEGFVGAVVRIQRQAENIGRAGGKRARRLAQTASPHIAHHRKPGRGTERPHQMKARDAADAGDLSSVNGRARWLSMYQSALLAGFMDAVFLRSGAIMTGPRALGLTALAPT